MKCWLSARALLLLLSASAGADEVQLTVAPDSKLHVTDPALDDQAKKRLMRKAPKQGMLESGMLETSEDHQQPGATDALLVSETQEHISEPAAGQLSPQNEEGMYKPGQIREIWPVFLKEGILEASQKANSNAASHTNAKSRIPGQTETVAEAPVEQEDRAWATECAGFEQNYSSEMLTPTAEWGFHNITICSARPARAHMGFAPTILCEAGGTGTPFSVKVYVRNYSDPADTDQAFDLNQTMDGVTQLCHGGKVLNNSAGVPICTTITCESDSADCLVKYYVRYAEVRVGKEEEEEVENQAYGVGCSGVFWALLALMMQQIV